MSIESNKQLVLRFCQLIGERKLDPLFELMHDEGSWTIPYRQDRFAFAGFKNKAAVREMVGGFLAGFSEFKFEVENITAEGQQVAVEAKSVGKGPGAATYQNVYHMHFEIRDGQVHTIREYFDPFEVLAYVEQLAPNPNH